EPDDSPSSSSSNSASKSSTDSQEYKPINFIPPEIDPKIFDQPFNFDDNPNNWIIL
ncbi:7092_t:CDS:1, partial [Ambispora leptoticha]